MNLSYAQNLEDYHLWLAFAGQPRGFYIDVGAGHPIADNVTFWLYERGWHGIAVEPQADLAALYGRLRPRDTVVTSAIGRQSGEIEFHVVDRLHGFSTTVEKNAAGAKNFGADYRTLKLPVMTMAELCAMHAPGEIDVLKIDVEGAEGDVLAGNDWRRYRPKVIVAEAIAPGTNEPNWAEWEPALLEQGYEFALFDTLNRFYVAREQTEILARFPRERADWGAVRHMYEIGRAPENALHPDHAMAKDLARGLWADLPNLDPRLLAALLGRARGITDDTELAALAASLSDETGRAALGRIACGYDGGQIHDE